MKGYIYTMFKGADPGAGWIMNDPVFQPTPTLGACVPNIRRAVQPGDHIFVISGRVSGVRQYVVGGFEVAEKIDAFAAYHRLPEYRMKKRPDGSISGNVIVTAEGDQSPVDYHTNFERRVENYIIGKNPITLDTDEQIARARLETLPVLSEVLQKHGDTVGSLIGRWRRLDASQIEMLIGWLRSVRGS